MRVRKDPKVRQEELIDAALALFSSAGYKKTMIVDIVKRAGVAKGTFFYYFSTKEAVLEAICSRWAIEIAASYQRKSKAHTAIKKLQSFISELMLPSQVDELIDKLWDEKEFNLVYTIWQQQVESIFNPLLHEIIEQGNQEGSMQAPHIKETIAFFWSTVDCLFDVAFLKEPEEVFLIKVKIAGSVLERILGIEEGKLEFIVSKV
ncbi:transcriptional regulator, TetR family [Propionispira arboris]|uniref:Transcriptional regulator, TetR family n=1 Tax=Propionispira arboris TaxID=84035 RepID=A0A1H6UVB1_9FIRM|nr:TetR/AcrR family transcriptional regulator [Propionispira arboris]SEI96299.1 transcriptional regulator, TetR family [Propionispira arboris]